MPETKACRYCGKVMPRGSLYRHEHVKCEQRPGGNGAADPKATAATARTVTRKPKQIPRALGKAEIAHNRVHVVSRTSGSPAPPGETAPRVATNGHCQECLFRDLGRHIDQDLVRRAVVGGMALDSACAFVREAKAALVT